MKVIRMATKDSGQERESVPGEAKDVRWAQSRGVSESVSK